MTSSTSTARWRRWTRRGSSASSRGPSTCRVRAGRLTDLGYQATVSTAGESSQQYRLGDDDFQIVLTDLSVRRCAGQIQSRGSRPGRLIAAPVTEIVDATLAAAAGQRPSIASDPAVRLGGHGPGEPRLRADHYPARRDAAQPRLGRHGLRRRPDAGIPGSSIPATCASRAVAPVGGPGAGPRADPAAVSLAGAGLPARRGAGPTATGCSRWRLTTRSRRGWPARCWSGACARTACWAPVRR